MTSPRPEVFVSYARKDAAAVVPLVTALEAEGVTVWRDGADLLGGQQFPERIAAAIADCKVMLLVCSPDALASEFVTQEVLTAFTHHKRKILPVWLTRPSAVPFALQIPLAGCHWIETHGKKADAAKRDILTALKAHGVSVLDIADPAKVPVATPVAPTPTVPRGKPVGGRRRRPWWVWATGLILFALLGCWLYATFTQPTLSERVTALIDSGDADRALQMCDAEVAKDPKSAAAWCERGRVKWSRNEFAAAVVDLDEAIRLDSKCAVAYARRGGVFADQNDLAGGLAECGRALDIDPQCTRALIIRSGIYHRLKQPDQAVRDIDQAIKLGGKDLAASHTQRGRLFAATNPDEAIRSYTASVDVKPTKAAYLLRARLHADKARSTGDMKQLELAVSDCTAAIRLDDRDAEAFDLRGTCHATKSTSLTNAKDKEAEYQLALADLSQAVRLAPGSPGIRAMRGAVRHDHGDYTCVEDYEAALALGYSPRKDLLESVSLAYAKLAEQARLKGDTTRQKEWLDKLAAAKKEIDGP